MKLFLVGMMGSGKTYWSRKLSGKNKSGAYDLDDLIENLEEKTIPEIFEAEGEAYFRKTESELLRWFGEKKSFVLATGGGTPCHSGNMEWMNKNGITVWIDESPEVLAERLKPEKHHRPLLKDLDDEKLIDFLRTKIAERAAFYSKAQYHLQGKQITDSTFARILKGEFI